MIVIYRYYIFRHRYSDSAGSFQLLRVQWQFSELGKDWGVQKCNEVVKAFYFLFRQHSLQMKAKMSEYEMYN